MATAHEQDWALQYNAYERFASDGEKLLELLQPAIAEYEATGRVPAWCGVDLLRAWAFFRQREANHKAHGTLPPDWDDVLDAIRCHPSAAGDDLPPAPVPATLTGAWAEQLAETLAAPFWAHLHDFLYSERKHFTVFPAEDQTFRAFELTPFDEVRVVILGQDPYPTPGYADGLAFSVSTSHSSTPQSLRNIFKELETDLGIAPPPSNSLEGWAEQGVLLLNTALTLRSGSDTDHQLHRKWKWKGQGWSTFTDAVIEALAARDERTVFVLWGNDAKKKAKLIDPTRHDIIEEVHPAGQSAHRGFFRSRPFSTINKRLTARGSEPIDWSQTGSAHSAGVGALQREQLRAQ